MKMNFTNENLASFLYKLDQRNAFNIKKTIWSDPQAYFYKISSPFDEVLITYEKSNIINDEKIVCILSDWGNIAEGIIFTNKAIYVNSPKNSDRNFRTAYDEIANLSYIPIDNPSITIITNNSMHIIDHPLWSKKNICIVLKLVSGAADLTADEKERISGIELENTSDNVNIKNNNHNVASASEVSGIIYGNVSNASTIYNSDKLATPRGHGFAAEQANHLVDKVKNFDIKGNKVKLVGDDNAKNGADRIVNGINIQSKYCVSGSKCISECFSNGKFRYLDSNGKPMIIEVPKDQEIYDGAVKAMENRIKNGEVPGVTDIKEAKNLVKKGHFTYNQAKNIAKAGTVESICYDSATGAIISTSAFGISTVMAFATAIWNGEEFDVAIKSAVHTGLKVGGTTFITAVLSSQLSKAGLNSALVASSEGLVAIMGPKASALIANAFRSGTNIYGAAAMKSAAKLLRGNAITAGVTVAVMSTVDIVNIFNGRISGKQLFKNITNTAATVAAGTAGWTAGASLGAAIGSILPGAGTAIGGFIGGLIGSAAAGSTASKATNSIMDNFIEDDADEMIKIVQDAFVELTSDYLLTQSEAEQAADILQKKLEGSTLKDMFTSEDRKTFAKNLIENEIAELTLNRENITMPDTECMKDNMISILEEIYDNCQTAEA